MLRKGDPGAGIYIHLTLAQTSQTAVECIGGLFADHCGASHDGAPPLHEVPSETSVW
jgi:hypothetical protein